MGMTKSLNKNRRFYLRERRQAAGMTQAELAEACGTTKGTLTKKFEHFELREWT
jgi:DNA-binding XRE family transcriptional regulator